MNDIHQGRFDDSPLAGPSAASGDTPPNRWPAVAAVGLATFGVVTTEMLPVGLLTPIAQSLQVSAGSAGLMLSAPALLAALFAPLIVLGAGSIDRRRLLAALLLALAGANVLCALAPTLPWLLAARVVVGFCIGGIWSVAGGLAPRLVAAPSVGWATAIIFGGVSVASVVGVPLGAWLGELVGWRAAFGAMAVCSGLIFVLNIATLPPLPAAASGARQGMRAQFRNRGVRLGLTVTFFLVAGHFMAYTFVRPLLQQVSGFGAGWIGVLLFGYGVAGMIANFAAGPLAGRHPGRALLAVALALSATLLLFATFGNTMTSGAALLLCWGLSYGAVSVSVQSWMLRAADGIDGIEAATALLVSVFNLGIALGSFFGGIAVDVAGLQTTLLIASALTLAGLVTSVRMQRAPSAASAGLAQCRP
ncbi:MFS transporter, DHA1 family, purine ribonucleoside efflux pump [Cupriavidus gilardii CR3]|uniref:MFS transporter n=1 Tax=Cupriavidus gilardii TaxID=82541 RepID=A0A849B623_9BURK|nr:MFS transporter [Cupriavidus gilardii]ALD93156.1 MFS transporter, DHA1 family, purine ribonucleoside efflux pump [Cupriavidus gilardii CR3]KAB0599433.1 MFS transporter [Cupriavidus gilardii]MCT9013069.1 MFS transporter [Cupriavidus gilardii]MCT9052623.1 MFS transporter [Cupriavidus gilardii]NNH10682.1 MFS transporter [Cupriavidus gilardii]